LLVILIVLFQASLKADSIPEIVAKAKPAIVEIVTTDSKGTLKKRRHRFSRFAGWVVGNKPACD
jgi:hypothetical protein